VKIAIFDMDGTLLDSAKDITLSVNATRKHNHGLAPLDEAFVIDAINKEHRNLAELFYGTKKYEKKDQFYFEDHYNEQCVQHVYLYEEIHETLLALRDERVRLSVATNAPSQFARRMLDKCGVYEYFDFVIGADRVKNAKPDKEMLEHILKGYSTNASTAKAIMIGDNVKDMQAAQHAGINGLFATWGFSPDAKHHTCIDRPKEILKHF